MSRLGILPLAVVLLVVASAAEAQPRWGRGATPRDGVCFYEDTNFRGEYFCLSRGQNIDSIPSGMNNRISSIRTFGNADVIVFRDTRFRGASARFQSDVRNLKSQGWNDAISSVRVSRSTWTPGRPPAWGRGGGMPSEGACFYQDTNFRGQSFCVSRGGSFTTLPPGFNDRISSVRVRRATVMIFRDRDFDGRSRRITSDAADLRGTWGDTISSLRVF
jgi:hypothetical protein